MAVEYLLVPSVRSHSSVRPITTALSRLPGVLLVTVDVNQRRVRLEHDGSTNLADVIRTIKALGHSEAALLT